MNRRDFLKICAGTGALAMMPRIGRGTPNTNDPLWINIQATGGWDSALVGDPKPGLRTKGLMRDIYVYGAPILGANGQPTVGQGTIHGATALQTRMTPGGGITYSAFADLHGDPANPNYPYKCFFPTYYDRVTLFCGIETGTLNHEVGIRYCASGSNNQGFPCFATQVAYVRGSDRPLAFMNLGGYAETAGLIAATPLVGAALPNLARLVAPNDLSGDNNGTDYIVTPQALSLVQQAHARRTGRLRDKLLLPEQRRGIDSLTAAESGQSALTALQFNGSDQSQKNVVQVGIDAFRQGMAVSMNIPVGGFDTHGDNEQGQALALFELFETIKLIINETEAPSNGKTPVPAVVVVTSDFGRSPYYRNAGTDHWPVTSMMVVQNKQALALGLAIPTNRVIGGTSNGDENQALRSAKVDPKNFNVDPNGVTMTPGHVMRALRRLAKIDDPKLAAWPLTVDKDLAVG